MGPVIAMMIIFGQLSLAAFLKWGPKDAEKQKEIRVFNMMIVGVCFFLCLVYFLTVRDALVDMAVHKDTMNFITYGGAMAIETVFMLVFLVVRNFWVFRGKNYNPNRLF